MRSIHARTTELEEFVDKAVPPYAILSHTWDNGEVSYQDTLEVLHDTSVVIPRFTTHASNSQGQVGISMDRYGVYRQNKQC